jgi:adhesin transport system outer membrane protein
LSSAISKNPQILASMQDIKAQKQLYAQIKSKYVPSVDVELSEVWSKNAHGTEVVDKTRSAMVVVKQNLFNGFADKNQRVKELKKVKLLNEKLTQTKRDLIEKLSISYNNFLSLNEEKRYLNSYIDASKKTMDDYNNEYDLGRRSLLDILSINQEYNTALNSAVKAKYDSINAYYEILTYEGSLLEKMDLKVNFK